MPITATELNPIEPDAASPAPAPAHAPAAATARGHRLATTPEWLLRVTVESTLIVLSILLALAVDGWKEGRDYQRLAEQSLVIFAQEIERNHAVIDDVIPYHVGLQQVVAEMAQEPDRVVDVHSIVEGMQPTVVLNTAWETALATGAFRHMNVNTVSMLSRMYGMQQLFRDQITLGRPVLFVTEATTREQKLEQMQHALIYLNDVVRAEQELLGVYELALAEINALGAPRAAPDTLLP